MPHSCQQRTNFLPFLCLHIFTLQCDNDDNLVRSFVPHTTFFLHLYRRNFISFFCNNNLILSSHGWRYDTICCYHLFLYSLSLPPLVSFLSCLGFTSKFDPYNVDEELLMAYNDDDDDDNINSNFFEIDETTTNIDNLQLQQQHQHQMDVPDFEYLHFRNLTILVGNTAYLKVLFLVQISAISQWLHFRFSAL